MQFEQSDLINSGIQQRLRQSLRHCKAPSETFDAVRSIYMSIKEDQRDLLLFSLAIELDARISAPTPNRLPHARKQVVQE
ncbi:hypothetical protein [uncultured Sulfitobacter sp.]|uniref:hypothetical protein n=1 Tax=uncultured Sulfitobacter sp. TaxID=191468 RepID=UPI0026095ADE|nr:hypothetical protein [uncultured Sulfitobacter sp.]